jgi:PPOX class probable FMN-dependent enzyme
VTLSVDRPVVRFQDRVSSREELRELYGQPTELVIRKQLPSLDLHARAFIARSPLALLGTSDLDGRCDVSPKGDGPGFALVLDDKTVVIPDRRGNRRIDSLQNIVDNPHVGLLFLIPGVDETLRVNGSAIIVRDEDLLERLAVQGSRPNVGVVVTVEETFFHCPKAFLRGHVWDLKSFISRKELPSLSRMILDQTRPPDRSDAEHERLVAEREAASVETNKCLY